MSSYEYSAWTIGVVVSGGSIEVGPSDKGIATDYNTPLPFFLGSGVAHAVAGMSRREGSKIVNALLEKYEARLPDPPIGKKYQECYDVDSGEPSVEAVDLYREVRRELTDQFGLKFSQALPYL